MSSVNKVILVGHLGRDPEVRATQGGTQVATLRIATSESWKDRNSGERRERTEWHTVVVWPEALVKLAQQYLRKGSKAYIEGQLQTRKWQDQQGNDRYSTEVVLQPFGGSIVLLDRREADPARNDYSSHQDEGRWSGGGFSGGGDAGGGATGASRPAPFDNDLDDDVPF